MDLQSLRERTRTEHEATEKLLPLMSPEITLPAYVDSLRALYRILSGWERWAEIQAPPELLPMLRERRRGLLLCQDLRHFGEVSLPDPLPLAAFDAVLAAAYEESVKQPAFLGALYVVEGSTLGGQYIARHVEQSLRLAPGEGDAYFVGYGECTGERWREVRAILVAAPDAWLDETVTAAKGMFGIFGAVLQEGSPREEGPQPVQSGVSWTERGASVSARARSGSPA